MSNLHVNLDEANKHTPKGFDNAVNNTVLVRSETGISYYEERMILPKAINFVDGTLPPPSTTDLDAFVLIGAGVIDAGWGTTATFGDWVRFLIGVPTEIVPLQGYLCYDNTAAAWMEYDGAAWNTFGGGGGLNTNLATNDLTLSASSRFFDVNGNTLQFKDGANNRIRIDSKGVAVGDSAAPILGIDFLIAGQGATSGTKMFRAENSVGSSYFEVDNNGHAFLQSNVDNTRLRVISVATNKSAQVRVESNTGLIGTLSGGGSAVGAYLNNALSLVSSSISSSVIFGSYTSLFKWYFGTSGTDANTHMKATDLGLLIGNGIGADTPQARLHVEGDLLVRNSSNLDMFKVATDSNITVNSRVQNFTHNIINADATGRSTIQMDNDGGIKTYYRLYGSNTGNAFRNNKLLHYSANGVINWVSASEAQYWTFGGNSEANADAKLTTDGLLLGQGIGASNPSAQLHVIGSTLLDGNFGVFGTTPIAQPTTGVASSIVGTGVGSAILDDDTFDGYTLSQVVKALRNLGLLA